MALYSGFVGADARQADTLVLHSPPVAARRRFSPEFMNRIDKIVVFKSLRREHLEEILDIELVAVQELIGHTNTRFQFTCTDRTKRFLLDEGIDPRYAARPLKRALEHYITFPLANLVASGQIEGGDAVTVDMIDGNWKFLVACTCEACQCGDSASCYRGARECAIAVS